jgi:hypothetical protein
VPEGLLKMAQRAAEEQKTMPDDPKKAGKPKIPASREHPHRLFVPLSLSVSLILALICCRIVTGALLERVMTSAVRREPYKYTRPYQTFWLSAVEKMFQQAMDEQHVEKLAKEGQKVRLV